MGTQLSNLCLQRRKTTEKGAREQSRGTLPCRDTLRTHWTHPQIPILSTYRGRLRFWETAYLPRDCSCLWSHTNGVKSKTDSKNAVFVSCVRSLPESISPLSGTYIISWDKYVIEPFSSTLSPFPRCCSAEEVRILQVRALAWRLRSRFTVTHSVFPRESGGWMDVRFIL